MIKNIIKYSIAVLVIMFLAYNSVYFRSLSALKAEAAGKDFNPAAYAKNYVKTELPPSLSKAPDVDTLLALLKSEPKTAFKLYSNALAVGNVRFFMVNGQGIVTSLGDNDITLKTKGNYSLTIATEFIFGNALRDASGIIKVEDFTNSTNLNNVSAEINKIVRETILPPFKNDVKIGDFIKFSGAFELNREHLNLNNIEIVPIKLAVQ